MAKFRIALLPGDGIGVDVLEAAKLVLQKIQLDDGARHFQGGAGAARRSPTPVA